VDIARNGSEMDGKATTAARRGPLALQQRSLSAGKAAWFLLHMRLVLSASKLRCHLICEDAK
jgi:hypothetical protein